MFDWVKYLTLAEELATRNQDEAALRSAVSRAYYAVFCTARGHLRLQRVEVPRKAPHDFVWNHYRHAGGLRRQIGLDGDRLKKNRNLADYEDSPFDLAGKVKDSIETARESLNALRNLDGS